MKKHLCVFIVLFFISAGFSQEYVNVTFRHYPTSTNVVRAFVPGTFNNWGPNSNGFIAPDAPSLMTYVDSVSFYYKTYRFRVGDTHQYKFHEHYNQSGTENEWYSDPLNPDFDPANYYNSIISIERLMFFEVSPKNDATINDATPLITAGVFSREFDPILLDQSYIFLDDTLFSTFSDYFISDLSILNCELPRLSNGPHQVKFSAKTQQGQTATDSVRFNVIAGEIFFFTPNCDSIFAARKTIRWKINLDGRNLQSGVLKQLDMYPITFQPQSNSEFSQVVNLIPGLNRYVVSVTDDSGKVTESDTLKLFYHIPQKPEPQIQFQLNGNKIRVIAVGNDPQGESVSFLWYNQPTNPADLTGIDGKTDESFEIAIPIVPGDYSIKLIVTDQSGHSNSTVNFFTVIREDSVIVPSLETVPQWVRDARIYCVFIKAFTPTGTIQAAIDSLHHIKNMGFNTVWVLPVMDVEGVVDQGSNIGYNIIDFYNVEPFYGTNEDFKDFVDYAHELGLRVILDVTPNHSSRSHPIALDVRSKKKFSRFYDFYQHEIILHNDNGLGQCISPDGIVYYCGFSDALLNWNWSDDEARKYMLDVYTHWLREYDIDGFRFDVYWGPNRRYGRQNFDQPLRAALRAAKADIMLLAETQGTGAGTELIYADQNGGVDLGYDWILKDAIWNFPSINNLNTRLYNYGYRPGTNSFFLRFLENHDEDRVAFRYNSIEKTIPVATAIFLATGIPLLYQGQEVGMGFGMGGSKDYRARSTVNWQNPPARILAPHYQKLAQIRAQFPAFRRQLEDTNGDGTINSSDKNMQPRLTTSSASVYAFARPYPDQNGVVVMNFSNQSVAVEIELNLQNWAEFSQGFQPDQGYYLNNLYTNTSRFVSGAELNSLTINLGAYQVAVFTISTQEDYVELPPITVDVNETVSPFEHPTHFQLAANFPNPFNSTTTIAYSLPAPKKVKLEIFNLQGQKICTLINQNQSAGWHRVAWNGLTESGMVAASGVYLYRLTARGFVKTRKMLFLK